MTERVWPRTSEIARDAFPFRYSSEYEILLLRGPKFTVGAPLFGEEDIAAADDNYQEDGDEGVRPADVEWTTGKVEIEDVSLGKDDEGSKQE
jgi:hypothetical protein